MNSSSVRPQSQRSPFRMRQACALAITARLLASGWPVTSGAPATPTLVRRQASGPRSGVLANTTGLRRACKTVVAWRFAPACCAAQPELRRGPVLTKPAYNRRGRSLARYPRQAAPRRSCFPSSGATVGVAKSQSALQPNNSLNRTHCGMRQKARHFILGL
jgi:hypothetical protein